jgi:hypothetical protein
LAVSFIAISIDRVIRESENQVDCPKRSTDFKTLKKSRLILLINKLSLPKNSFLLHILLYSMGRISKEIPNRTGVGSSVDDSQKKFLYSPVSS